jgi:hypothetical protein
MVLSFRRRLAQAKGGLGGVEKGSRTVEFEGAELNN